MKVLEKVRQHFSDELENEGDVWRILRKGTLVDLIKLSYFHFQNDSNEKHLIEIFNNSIKVLLLSQIKAIEVKGDLENVSKEFKKENSFILDQYNLLLEELKATFEKNSHCDFRDLQSKISYIKVINELELDSYADDVFEEIAGITYNILKANLK